MAYTPPTPIEWMTDWRRVEPMAQRAYVKSELERIAAAGAQVLTQVLTLPLQVQTDVALRVLHEEAPLPGHRWCVRLIEGAQPKLKDPEGRDLPPHERGKVHVVKVGTRGGQLRDAASLPGSVTAEYAGPALQARAARGQDNYVHRRIGHAPVDLSLGDAVVVLGKYGYGVPLKRYWGKRPPSATEPQGFDGWDSWILEEVTPAMLDALTRPPKRAA